MVQSLFLSPLLWTPTSLIGALMLLRRIKNSKLQSILRRGPKSKHRCRATRTSSDLTLGKTRVYLLLFQKVRSWLLETIRMTCLKQSILIKTFKAKINLWWREEARPLKCLARSRPPASSQDLTASLASFWRPSRQRKWSKPPKTSCQQISKYWQMRRLNNLWKWIWLRKKFMRTKRGWTTTQGQPQFTLLTSRKE